MTTKATKNAKGGGTIRKRSDGRWEARYTLGIDPKTGKQIQKSVYGKTQKEVRQKLTAITAEIDDGTYMDIPRLKTADWLNTWVAEYIGNVKSSTRKSYQDHVRLNIIPYIGNVPLSKVTAAMIQQMYNELQTKKELSPKTIKNVHGVLHRALEQAQKMGYIRSDPLAAVTLPRIEKKQIKPLEDEELSAFLKEIRGNPYELVYFVTVFTGLRQGEVLGLTWDCVNFEKQTLLINKQHGKKKGTREYCFSSLKNDRPRVIEVADGVMVARGDLGIEVPQERIPGIQRVLIRKCILAKKPVIVATQMLHTMINNPRPTRAEVTDIANAIYYRTDALMLSGETAYGKYPVEAVKTMTKVAAQAEKDKLSENDIRIPLDESSNDVTAFLAKQAVKATSKLKIRAIITDSFSGRTARNIAAFRGKYPVLAICYKEKTMRHLALSYGVEAIYMPEKANGQAYYFAALRKLLDDGVLCESDMVAYLSSGKQGTQTSFLEINVVGDVLKYAMDYVLPNRNRYL